MNRTLLSLNVSAAMIGAFFLFLVPAAFSQHGLTLEEALDMAFEGSYTARSAREQLRASEAAAEAARLSLYSRVDMEFDVPDYSRTLFPQFNPITGRNEFFPLERTQWSGRLDVNQPLIWTNSTITLSGLLYQQQQRDLSPDGEPFRDWYTDLAIQLRQPLLVPNTQRIALRNAEIDFEESMADYVRNTLELRYAVTEQFYNLYASQERLTIQEDRVRQENETYTTGLRKYRAGLIAEVEALQFEVDLAAARNDLLAAQNTLVSRANQFKILLGMPIQDSLYCVLRDTTVAHVQIDPVEATVRAKRTRVDLQRAKNNIERSELALENVHAARSIRGDLFLSYGLNSNDAEFAGLYNDLRDTRRAVLTVSIPVFDWGKHSQDVEAAEARLRNSQLAAENLELNLEREILDLIRSIESASRRAEVLKQSRHIAEIANDISTKRYEVGTIGSTELAQARSRLLQARLSALEAVIDYHLALADMARRTAFDFRSGKELDVPR
ncbi:MAG: TolC family protein [Bacteroidetes bacterium]|nr:TolC family protein [Bacteroidota bacterium]